MTTEERIQAELDRDKRRWQIRRRITLSCVFANFAIILFYMITPFLLHSSQIDMLREFNSIAITLIGGNFSVILAYFGLNSYEQTHQGT